MSVPAKSESLRSSNVFRFAFEVGPMQLALRKASIVNDRAAGKIIRRCALLSPHPNY
jgi:hypothetical protein